MTHLLIIEDDRVDQMAFERFARSEKFPYSFQLVNSIRSAKNALKNHHFDAVVSDFFLGDGTAFEILQLKIDLPIIVVTGTGSEEIAVDALKKGAYDYLIKDIEGNYLKMLPITIKNALERYLAEKELKKYHSELEEIIEKRTKELRKEIEVRKTTENRLAQFEKIVENSADMLALLDSNYHHLLANKAYSAAFDLNAELLTKTKLENLVDLDFFNSNLKPRLLDCLSGNTNNFQEWLNFPVIGKRYIDITFNPYYFEDSTQVGIVVSGRDFTEKKRAQDDIKALHKREHLLAEVVRTAPLGIAYGYPDGRLEHCNNGFSILTGYSLEELQNIKWNETLTPKKWEKTESEILSKLTVQNRIVRYEKEYIHKNGNIIPIELVVAGNFNEQNELIHYTGFIIDISERKKSEQALQKAHDQLSNTLENMSDGFVSLDENWCYTYVNRRVGEMFNRKPTELLGKQIWKEFPDIINQPFYHYLHQAKENQSEINFENYYPPFDRWYENHVIPNNNGLAIFFQDITERKIAHEQIQSKHALLSALINSVNNIKIFALDKHYCYTVFNEAHQKEMKLVWNADIEIGTNILESITIPEMQDAVRQNIERTLKNETFSEVVHQPESDTYNHMSWSPILYLDETIGVTVFVQDITDRKRWELELQKKNEIIEIHNEEYQQINEELSKINKELIIARDKALESDRLKSAFLANMSHEIRTPMNGILGFAELLKKPRLSGQDQKKYIEIIEKSGIRMLNIINDLVDISKVESGQMEIHITETNVVEQLDYIYTFFKPEAENKKLTLTLSHNLTHNSKLFKTDREKVYAILTNLVKNAIKYTEKGSIEMGVEDTEDSVVFFVKDSGMGIPESAIDVIFNRFVQADLEDTKALQGAGLGLTISKAYVEMLGGSIWVKSIEGKGSEFYFSLPIRKFENLENRQTSKNLPSDIRMSDKKMKILIVEDDETSEMLLNIAVQSFSEKILTAVNGIEAIEMCRNEPDIDLILMDIKMPDMDGYEATRKIREFNKTVRIIAQTAFGLSGDKEKAIAAGCNDYISKPIVIEELKAKISKWLL